VSASCAFAVKSRYLALSVISSFHRNGFSIEASLQQSQAQMLTNYSHYATEAQCSQKEEEEEEEE
jgi:hypothetical protein